MNSKVKVSLSLALVWSLCLPSVNRSQGASAESVHVVSSYNQLPLTFEPNLGQTDNRVKFLARGKGYTLFLTNDEAVFSMARVQPAGSSTPPASAVLRTRFVGANADPTIAGTSRLSATSNYFLGSDPAKWRIGVPGYSRVRYGNVYPGIDLIYYGRDGQLEYDLVLAPRADPHRIRLAVTGADQLNLNPQGDVILTIGGSQVTMRKPFLYQEAAGARHAVKAAYVLISKDEIGLQIGPYDSGKTLVVDPALVYSGYLGGSGSDSGLSSAVDSKGNAYVAGDTTSTDFPKTSGVVQSTFGGIQDAFVAKFNSKGTALVWSTYLGGSDNDIAWSVSVDKSSNVYLAGETRSTNFPVTAGAFQTALKGTKDGFIAKLNSTATSLIYSTYLGGSGKDSLPAMAVDSSGNAYVTGTTQSPDFPVTAGAFQTKCAPCGFGGSNAFITKLNSTGSALVYSTYLGGSAGDVGVSIAVDSSNNAYVTGETVDHDFPTLNPIQASFAGGGTNCSTGNGAGGFGPCGDAFVTKLNASGSALVYSTYLGGSGEDGGFAIKVDSTGAAYVAGGTDSSNFPTIAGAFQTTFGGGANGCANNGFACGDAFVTKINSSGNALTFSTYLGGSGDDVVLHGLAVDSSKNVHLAGGTNSSNFPVTANATQPTYGGGTNPCPMNATCGDAFQTVLNSSGSGLLFSTYLGGSADDGAAGMALDANGYRYLVGATASSNFPIAGKPFQSACKSCASGIPDAFVTKIGPSADLKLTNSAPGSVKSGSTLTYTIVVDNLGPDTASSLTISDNTPTGTTFNSVTITNGKCTSPAPGSSGSVKCTLASLAAGASVTETLVINVTAPPGSTISDKASVTSKTFDPNTKNNSAIAKTSVT
jgi:uncharacterized repeat protein (TIGR01451 family)